MFSAKFVYKKEGTFLVEATKCWDSNIILD